LWIRTAIAGAFLTAALSIAAAQPFTLDDLFAELATAPDPFSAARVEAEIREVLRETGSPSADLLLDQGDRAERGGGFALALAKYDGAHAAAPAATEPLFARARALLALDRPREAAVALDGLLALEPRHLPALLLLSAVRQSLGETERAADLLNRVLRLNPQSADASRMLLDFAPGEPG
jgi:tetratricopeptide (TPR) repeat protein